MKKRILLVVFDEDFRWMFVHFLRSLGYEPREAKTGQEGIELAKNTRPDLIILDLSLPDLNGFEVLVSLKNDPSTADIPVVVQTAWPAENLRENALQAGAVAFISQPISPIVLNETIKIILDPAFLNSHAGLPPRKQIAQQAAR